MKLSAGQLNNNRYKVCKSTNLNRSHINQAPINFGIRFQKIQDKITVSNAQALIQKLDNLFGENFFSKQFQKAGGEITEDVLSVKKRSFFEDDFKKTIMFPITDIIPSIAKKNSEKTGKIIDENSWIGKLIKQKETDDARYLVLDILEEFSQRNYKDDLDFNELTKKFQNNITSNITKVKKNYATRDERTLNRAITSIVSSFFSSWDFYNISMLEKDDKNEATKAKKGRRKQDLTRMGFNAGLTFVALGMLDRYTKRNIVLNSFVIAGSALIAEISSRLISKTPLRPITPEEAAKIAQARKNKKAQLEKQAQVQVQNPQNGNISFKSNLKDANEIFSNFKANDGTFTALTHQKRQIANEGKINSPKPQIVNEGKKKKMSLGKFASIAFGATTAFYFIMRLLKGDYKAIDQQRKFLNSNIDKASQKAFEEVNKIISAHDKQIKKVSLLPNLKKALTTHKVKVNINELKKDLISLKATDEGKKIEGLIDKYLENIETCISQKLTKDGEFTHKKDIFIVSGFIEGLTKIFKTIYDILTIPAKLIINPIIDNYLTDNNKVTKQFNKIADNLNIDNGNKFKKELAELSELFKANKAKNNSQENIVNEIIRRTRNVETSAETGELANTSRTMVTAIATYFFVNDYRNKVLIESEGKNVEGAKTEANERIWHKIFNFIINGTLMNIFNTTFKTTVNSSLLGATAIATTTETLNETLIRKSICQPILPQDSKQKIIDYENKQLNKKGFWGTWSRTFKKITGKKSLTEKTGISKNTKQA